VSFSKIYSAISKIPCITDITDAVHHTLGPRGRYVSYASIFLGSVVNQSEQISQLFNSEESLVQKGYCAAALAIPLALCWGTLRFFSAPLPILNPRETKMIAMISRDINLHGSPSEETLCKLFGYAFGNALFSKRLESIIEQNDEELVERFSGYLEMLQEFSFHTRGLTFDLVRGLRTKLEGNFNPSQAELLFIIHLSEIQLDEDISQFLDKDLIELMSLCRKFIVSMDMGTKHIPVGAIIVHNENKFAAYKHEVKECYFDLYNYSHAQILCESNNDEVKVIDITYDGIELRKIESIRNILCTEVLTLDFVKLISDESMELLLELYPSEESVLENVEKIYQEKIQRLAQKHSANPHMIECAGTFYQHFNLMNKFQNEINQKVRSDFDDGQFITCSAFVGKLVERAIGEVNEHILDRFVKEVDIEGWADDSTPEESITDGDIIFVRSPFPPFISLESLAPADFVKLDSLSSFSKQFGKLTLA
jgi:hypothetical protein